jgi:MFS transporter, PPP family, 3-phenylpropionic acid transporter
MPVNPQEPTAHFAWRLALFYAALFVALGIMLPFLPVWLAAKGLDPQTIGIVLAVPIVFRFLAIPIATRAADRHDALKPVIMIAAVSALAGFTVLGLAEGILAIAVIYTMAATAYMPLFVLSDVYALRTLAPRRRAYGPVRLWGSAAFIVSTLGAGASLDFIAARDLIWLVVAAMACCAIAGWVLPAHSTHPPGEPAPAARPAILLRDPSFIAVAAAASLIQASHALYYSFSTIDWQAAGFDGGTIGALWALGVLAEIVLFPVSGRSPAAFTPRVLLIIGAFGALIRWTAMALGPPDALLPVLQCLHALSFGATHLGTLAFIARAAPAGLGATAQGYLAVVMGVAMAAATGAAGVLYAHFVGRAYGAMALIAAAGLLAAILAHRRT